MTDLDRRTLLQGAGAALAATVLRPRLAFAAADSKGVSPVMTTLSHTHAVPVAFGLVMILVLCHSGYAAVNAVVKAELFPAHIRALGVALPYALANTIFGGTAEYVALWFKSRHMESGFYWYVTAMIACSLLVYLGMRETKHTSHILED